MRHRLITICLLFLLAGGTMGRGLLASTIGVALTVVGSVLALDLHRRHREHIETALTLSASSSIPQLRNRLAHERRQRLGRR